MSEIKEYFQSLVKAGTIPQEPMNYDAATLKIYIDHLEAENAALRERVKKAVEFPCKVGDNVFCLVGIDPAVEEFEVEEILIKRSDPIFAVFRLRGIDIGVKTSCVLSQFGKRWFTELEDAEARLAELKGDKE